MERLTRRNRDGEGEIPKVDLDTSYSSEVCLGYSEICVLQEGINKLADYEDAEENGMLIKPPCKVGDTVWVRMQNGGFAEAEVVDYTHFLTCGFCLVLVSKKFCKQNIPFSEVGKTVFLTREEAEKALKEREIDNG